MTVPDADVAISDDADGGDDTGGDVGVTPECLHGSILDACLPEQPQGAEVQDCRDQRYAAVTDPDFQICMPDLPETRTPICPVGWEAQPVPGSSTI